MWDPAVDSPERGALGARDVELELVGLAVDDVEVAVEEVAGAATAVDGKHPLCARRKNGEKGNEYGNLGTRYRRDCPAGCRRDTSGLNWAVLR